MEETTKLFAEVQSAYEVLSDGQERAWYDSHRDMILRGDDAVQRDAYERNVRVTTTDDIMKMLPRVNACRDFSDSQSSFYTLLGAIFDNLAREEELACEWENIDPVAYPSFGLANDGYDTTVRAFYAAWGSFATRKTFSWKDIYRYSEAPDRRIRRLMEKENKRLREEAVREFNDAVRSLVAFVKKRDPRFKPSAQSEVERQKVLRDAASAQAARSRAANQSKAVESVDIPQWAQSTGPQSSEESDAPEADTREVYECVVCDKIFRSEKQSEAHERSRKHIKAARQVRRAMQQDDKHLHLGKPAVNDSSTTSTPGSPTPGSQLEADEPFELEKGVEALSVNDASHLDESGNGYETGCGRTSAAEPYSRASPESPSTSTSDDEYADRKHVGERILGQHNDQTENVKHAVPSSQPIDSSEEVAAANPTDNGGVAPQRKIGKAKARGAKKAAQISTASPSADAEVSRSQATATTTILIMAAVQMRQMPGRLHFEDKAVRPHQGSRSRTAYRKWTGRT